MGTYWVTARLSPEAPEPPGPGSLRGSGAQTPPHTPLNILMVEDNRGDLVLFEESLRGAGLNYCLTHMEDGEVAARYVERFQDANPPERPDVVLLDLNLPRRDGWELLQLVRGTAALTGLPVVIFSSSAAPSDIARAKQFDRVTYMRKPPSLEEFMAVGPAVVQFALTHSANSRPQ